MPNPKYVLFTGGNGEIYFRLQAANGETILSSEGYSQKSGAENGVASVRKNAPLDERYQRKTASNGSPYFVLVAGNGEPIGRSEMYSSEEARDNGIEAVKKVAPDAPVEDATD